MDMLKTRKLLLLVSFLLCFSVFFSFMTPIPAKAITPTPTVKFDVNDSFNGTSDYEDKTSSLSSVENLTQGSIVATFKTTSTASALTILSASDTGDASSNITLCVSQGSIYFEVREDGDYSTQQRYPVINDTYGTADYADGDWHTAVITVSSTLGTKFYMDGYQVHADTSTAFFSSVNDLDGMYIGKNVDSGGSQWYYSGDIGTVSIYNTVLDNDDILELSTPPTAVLDYAIYDTFNGSSTSYTKTSDLGSVSGLSQGAIMARFKTSSTAAAKTIFSASDSGDASSNVTLSINTGNLHFESRENGTYDSNITVSGSYNDGDWHTIIVTVDSSTTKIYLDGANVYSGSDTGFFSSVNDLDGMWVGKNVDSGGDQWFFAGDLKDVQIYSSALDLDEVMTLSAETTCTLDYHVDYTFGGASPDYFTKTSHLSEVSSLSQGAIAATFKTSSANAVKTILSASDSGDASSNITLSVNDGDLHFEVREAGTYSKNITVEGDYNDDEWHTVVVSVDSTGTRMYADGYQVYTDESSGVFFSSVNNLDGMWVGRNVDSGGGQWYFAGQIGDVMVFDKPINNSIVKRLSGADLIDTIALFDNGYSSAAFYRIPALITTTDDTLIAAVDQRQSYTNDSPNDINLAIRRSTDSGATWSSATTILDYPGTGLDGASTIDSVLLQDESTDRIFILVDHFPGGVGAGTAETGTGFSASGYKLLYDSADNEYTLRANGAVYDSSNNLTDYVVDSDGDVTDDGDPAGNIYLKEGDDPNESLLEARTSFLVLLYSDDDGVTWSDPIDLNHDVKASWMKFMGTGPGRGIQLENGDDAGRLIFPVYFSNQYYNSTTNNTMSNAVIYSDDNGATWERGESTNDGRSWDGGTIYANTVTDPEAMMHESQIVELDDGTLKMYARNGADGDEVAVATSTDGGETWSNTVSFMDDTPEVGCMISAISYPDQPDELERVLLSNATRRADSPMYNNARCDGVIRLSEDGGSTWKHSKTFRQGAYAYSCMTVLPNGDIGLFWEMEHRGLYFSKFPLSWIEDS